jgi:integrase
MRTTLMLELPFARIDLRRHARDAGLPDIRLHDARHTAASLMLSLGYPVHVVATWLGHNPVMTQRV